MICAVNLNSVYFQCDIDILILSDPTRPSLHIGLTQSNLRQNTNIFKLHEPQTRPGGLFMWSCTPLRGSSVKLRMTVKNHIPIQYMTIFTICKFKQEEHNL